MATCPSTRPNEVKRLKELEEEKRKLKKLLAESMLDSEAALRVGMGPNSPLNALKGLLAKNF